MKNCLVTKLKAVVNNGNLETLGEFFVNKEETTTNVACIVQFYANRAGERINVVINNNGVISEDSISSTTLVDLYQKGVLASTAPSSVKFSPKYNFKALNIETYGSFGQNSGINGVFSGNDNLQYFELRAKDVDGIDVSCIDFSKLKVMSLKVEKPLDTATLNAYFANKDMLKVAYCDFNGVVQVVENVTLHPNVRMVFMILMKTSDVPANCEHVTINTLATGSIEEFVGRARAYGRTSGECYIFNGNNLLNVTLDGVDLKTACTSAGISGSPTVVWTNNSIELQSKAAPTDIRINNYQDYL